MSTTETHGAAQTFDDVILDQDFDEWQSDLPMSDIEGDADFADLAGESFELLAHDSNFRMGELDFSHEF